MNEEQRVLASAIPVVFHAEHREAGLAMAEVVERTGELLRSWGLRPPLHSEIRVLTDWAEFIDRTAPAWLRPLLALTRPLWRGRAERAYALAGGWMIPWPGLAVVGVKPPELLAHSEPSLGDRLFVPVPEPLEKVRHLTCHELTHAFTAHLRLPAWLNEGLAMRAVDHLAGRPTVLEETRDLVGHHWSELETRAFRRIAAADHDALIRLYATGYWVTRRLDEERLEVLQGLLERRRPRREVLRTVEGAYRSCRGE